MVEKGPATNFLFFFHFYPAQSFQIFSFFFAKISACILTVTERAIKLEKSSNIDMRRIKLFAQRSEKSVSFLKYRFQMGPEMV